MTNAFTTEGLLVNPGVFGISTLSPVQRAWCRALDGLSLEELAEDLDVLRAFGGKVPEAGTPTREAHLVLAIRCAKSMTAAAKAIVWTQTVDVSPCSAGDIIRIPVVSLTLGSTKQVMAHLLSVVLRPALRPLVMGEPSLGGIVLRHPSGRPIEIVPVPLDRAGGSATSVFCAGAIIDEAPRMVGAQDGTKNYDHLVQTLEGRILDGGQLLAVGSPWAPMGPIYDVVQERFGKPGRDVLVVRAPGPLANPTWWTPARCEALLGKPSYQTDVLGEFADPLSGLLSASWVRGAVREGPTIIPARKGAILRAAIDPSEAQQGGNGFALCIMQGYTEPARGDVEGAEEVSKFEVLLVKEWRPTSSAPLSLHDIFRDVARHCERYGISEIGSDQWSKVSLREIAARAGLNLKFAKQTVAEKTTAWENFVTAFESGAMAIPNDKLLIADLLGARRRVTQNGTAIELPTTPDGRHADMAAAVQLCFSRFANSALFYDMRRRQAQAREFIESLAASGFEDAPALSPTQLERASRIHDAMGLGTPLSDLGFDMPINRRDPRSSY